MFTKIKPRQSGAFYKKISWVKKMKPMSFLLLGRESRKPMACGAIISIILRYEDAKILTSKKILLTCFLFYEGESRSSAAGQLYQSLNLHCVNF
jgi:hypothetical protein